MSKKKAVVFDLDGTLVDVKKYERHHKSRHEGFADEAEKAPEIKKNVDKLRKADKKEDIVVMTARSADYRPETEDWLSKHDIKPDKLVMRPGDNERTSDKDIKERLFQRDVSPQFKVTEAYDDKSKNVNMLKKHGIKAKKV